MGELSSTLVTHNHVSLTALPQPTLSLVVEDEDEPPSSGPHFSRTSEMNAGDKLPELSHQTTSCISQCSARTDQEIGLSHRVTLEPPAQEEHFHHSKHSGADLEKLETVDEPDMRRRDQEGPKPSFKTRFRAAIMSKRPSGPRPTYYASFMAALRYTSINILLLCIPVSWALHFTHQSPTLIFVFSGLGIVPLAALLGLGTEQIALSTTQSVGGLLNASLGNLIEMIISGIALKKVIFIAPLVLTNLLNQFDSAN